MLRLDAVHIGLPKGTAVHPANLVHRLRIKGRIGNVNSILKPTHTVGFVRSIRLNGDARDEYCGLGALGRAAGGKSEGEGGENKCFFHCGYGLKVKKLVAFEKHSQHGGNKPDGGDGVG
jgi:hypothetical protein